MHIRRATRQDLPDIATVVARAMSNDELSLWLSPDQNKYPHIHRDRCLRMTTRRWNFGKIILVMVTDEGDNGWDGRSKVVAYAAYEKEVGAPDDSSKASATLAGAFERFLFKIEDNYYWYFSNYFNTNKARFRQCAQVVATCSEFSKYEKYWELDFLCTDPAFIRRGLGARLVEWGQQRAIEDAVPLLLWSSSQGQPLYLRMGFIEVNKLSFDQNMDAPVMRWDPPSKAMCSERVEK